MINCIGLYNWDRVVHLYNRDLAKFKRISIITKNIISRIKLKKAVKFSQFDAVIFGHYLDPPQRCIASNFINKPVVLVDDGIFTFQLPYFRELEVKGMHPVGYNSQLNQILLPRIWGQTNLQRLDITLFTMYHMQDVKGLELQLNRMEWLQQKLRGAESTNDCYFIGSNLSETGVVEEQIYLDLLIRWKNQFPNTNNPYYLVKFSEDPDKIRKVVDLGFSVIRPDIPVELYFILNRVYPMAIGTVLSSAILNLYLLFGRKSNTIFNYIELSDKQISPTHRRFVKSVFQNYQGYQCNTFQGV